jgi:hypothetical protein
MEEAPLPAGISPFAPTWDAEIEKAGIMFAVPSYGGVIHPAARRGLRDARRVMQETGIPAMWAQVSNESVVHFARNTLVAHFLASSCAHMLMVDADMGFTGAQVLRLLCHRKPLIGAICRRKVPHRRDWTGRPLRPASPRDPVTGAFEMEAIGTGMVLIAREVIVRMCEAWPHLRYQTAPGPFEPGDWRGHLWALFDTHLDPETRTFWSEDYTFCRRWRQLGGQVWADPALQVQHWGYVPPSDGTIFDDEEPAVQDICFAGDPLADMIAEAAAARMGAWP